MNANFLLADSMSFILNELISGDLIVRFKLNKFKYVQGAKVLYSEVQDQGPAQEGGATALFREPLSSHRQRDRHARLKTSPSRNFFGER